MVKLGLNDYFLAGYVIQIWNSYSWKSSFNRMLVPFVAQFGCVLCLVFVGYHGMKFYEFYEISFFLTFG